MPNTPQQAIREHLASIRLPDLAQAGAHLPVRMQPDTTRFVKMIEASGRQLRYVTCEADSGPAGQRHWRWMVLVTEEETGRWTASSVAGGSGYPPELGYPRADLGGSWGHQGFVAGGTIEDPGKLVTRVRLTDAAGRTFEDAVDKGVVLFFSSEPVAMPMRVDLHDNNGLVVASDGWGFPDE